MNFWKQFGLGALGGALLLALAMLVSLKAHAGEAQIAVVAYPPMLENILVAILPVLIVPVVSLFRSWTADHIDPKYIPLLLAVIGAVISSAYAQLGMGVMDVTALGADAWNGAIVGLASTGVHQLFTQLRKPS